MTSSLQMDRKILKAKKVTMRKTWNYDAGENDM
jgi:hypothetical protein